MKSLLEHTYRTARAIIIQDGSMLAFHRKRYTRAGTWIEYYSIPGGEIDKGETPEQAVVRELQEEMGVEVRQNGLVAHHVGPIFEHYIFSATIIAGKATFQSDSEEAVRYVNDHNQYKVVWVPIEVLSRENLKFYGIFYDHIVALSEGKSIDEVNAIPIPESVY